MAYGITELIVENSPSASPARTHRESGKVWVNSRFIGVLPPEYWYYILAHEEGHIIGDNRSELVADEHASAKFMRKYPKKPFLSVNALKNVLPMTTPEHHIRVEAQTKRAAKFDCNHNGNKSSCEILKKPDSSMIGYDEISIIEKVDTRKVMYTAKAFMQMLYLSKYPNGKMTFKVVNNTFIGESECKPGQYACIAAETKRKLAEQQVELQRTTNDAQYRAALLEYNKTLLSLYAMGAMSEAEMKSKQAELELERQKLAAKQVDSKKLLTFGLIAAAALVAVFFIINLSTTETA